jgi:hypothetical protein
MAFCLETNETPVWNGLWANLTNRVINRQSSKKPKEMGVGYFISGSYPRLFY